MTNLLPLVGCRRALLVPALIGLALGSLPGIGLILWGNHRTPLHLHGVFPPGVANDAGGFNAVPAFTADRTKPSSWEIPNG